MKFENIDLVDALRRIMDIHTQNYKEDFELDAGLLHSLAASQSSEDKHLLWMSRPNGTYLLPEREVYVEDSYENKVWEFYHEQTRDPILAYNEEVSLTDITDRKNPVPFHERLSIVRSYVEEAPAESLWKAMDRREHPSQKKTSVLAKLKEHAQTAPDKGANKPEQTKKPKSKEMEM